MSLSRNGWQTEATECVYKEYDRQPTKQLISGFSNDYMIDEILREVATLEDIDDAMNEYVLIWACEVETQSAQKQH